MLTTFLQERARAEANNLAEALRKVNARLVEVTAERDALREPLAQARMHQVTLEKRIAELEAERALSQAMEDDGR